MTGGIAVVLGVIGANFGAGMTGGMAFVYDADDTFSRKANPDSIVWQRLASAPWAPILPNLIQAHFAAPDSPWAAAPPVVWILLRSAPQTSLSGNPVLLLLYLCFLPFLP